MYPIIFLLPWGVRKVVYWAGTTERAQLRLGILDAAKPVGMVLEFPSAIFGSLGAGTEEMDG